MKPKKRKTAMFKLTLREREVLRLLAAGFTYAQVARSLGISLHTVGSHIKNLYRKLDVHNAAAAVSRAFVTGGIHEY
jgi:DNA-binding CsgD family transcriptional regulator